MNPSDAAAAATANSGTFSPATLVLGIIALIPLLGLGLLIWLRLKKSLINDSGGNITSLFYKETDKAYSFSLIGFIFSIIFILAFILLNIVIYGAIDTTSDFPMETIIFMGYIYTVYPLALFSILITWIYTNKNKYKIFQIIRLIITIILLTSAILPFLFLKQM